jgi:hypothetical protein
MWIGSEKEVTEWLPKNTVEMSPNKINFALDRFYKCNVFVHQAKIQPGLDMSGMCDPKLVIVTNGSHAQTKASKKLTKCSEFINSTFYPGRDAIAFACVERSFSD